MKKYDKNVSSQIKPCFTKKTTEPFGSIVFCFSHHTAGLAGITHYAQRRCNAL